jgi:hypothetical protein
MRFIRAVMLALAISAVLPIGAAIAGEVSGDLHTGLYSDDFDSSGDLIGVTGAAGQGVPKAGKR